ncbi:MAG TPA: hypothetical protein VKB50_09945 [Vicinamibacterales bacterium]|nr:hypothetical protein [Vicinamibacterales bacterium]
MTVLTRTFGVVLVTLLCAAAPLHAAQNVPPPSQPTPTGQAPPQQSEYVPISQLPPQDQLPAARLLIAAYSFVLVVFFLYVVSLARRLTSVQRDVDRLGASLKQSGKP